MRRCGTTIHPPRISNPIAPLPSSRVYPHPSSRSDLGFSTLGIAPHSGRVHGTLGGLFDGLDCRCWKSFVTLCFMEEAMPARTSRREARERIFKVMTEALDRMIPPDEMNPLRGSTFGDWEEQAAEVRRAVIPTLLEGWAGAGGDGRGVLRV